MTGPFRLPQPGARRPVVAHRSAAAPIPTGVPSRGTRGRAFWGSPRDPQDRVGCPFAGNQPISPQMRRGLWPPILPIGLVLAEWERTDELQQVITKTAAGVNPGFRLRNKVLSPPAFCSAISYRSPSPRPIWRVKGEDPTPLESQRKRLATRGELLNEKLTKSLFLTYAE